MSANSSMFVKVEMEDPQQEEPQTSEKCQNVCEYKWTCEKSFGDLWKDGKYCDVCFLTSDGHTILANRIVLATASQIFLEMFDSESDENHEPIPLNLDQTTLMNLLTLIYFNKVLIPQDQRKDFDNHLRQFGIQATIEERNQNPNQFANWTPEEMLEKFGKRCEEGFVCMVPGCLATIKNKAYLKVHFRVCHIELGVTYICPKCNGHTKSTESFRKHMAKNHPELKKINYRDLLPEPIFGEVQSGPMKRKKFTEFAGKKVKLEEP